MSPHVAGRELDALVAEKVIGIQLTALTVSDYGEAVMSAMSDSWPGHAEGWLGLNFGGRTFRVDAGREYYAEHGNDGYGVWCWNNRYGQPWETDIERHVNAWRRKVAPYSTDIAAAWTVLKKVVDDGYMIDIEYHTGALGSPDPDDMPLIICRAALRAVGVEL